ncbi:ABC transporter permease [Sediminispirochaeta smaragdinae]|jgi:simple sugar transport system permease protein|uniref:Inner-membrane translocator n=1 Tax=Sediminispirochaeta smaragdinae (strain DSM 11293 / JCM 15392 / SEBR 4228) TaxID=573413 RepID=E1R2E8_SEDSS|nr:ABC transporter permease [Sediminispirochaeta smaragdinae]ADK82508.1 inner-membrane translocator [Sediminispirochaeta smaragdinae DSM 11293]
MRQQQIGIKAFIRAISHKQLFLPIFALCLVLLFNIIKTPAFFNISIQNGVLYGYIVDIINRASELIILSVGMTLVIASGGIDISVGAVSALAAAVCVRLLGSSYDFYATPLVLSILAACVAGLACGAFNGFLVAKMKIQAMVATLILFTAGRGIAQLISAREINGRMVPGQILYVRMDSFKNIGGFLPRVVVPTPVFIAIGVVLLAYLLLTRTALGLYIKSVGINSGAGRLVGINSVFITFLCYLICGLTASVAGVISASRIYSCDANNIGLYMELDAILAVAMGGNSLAGGKFSLAGSVIGAITIQALTTSLYAMGVTADQLPVYKAIVVVLIVAIQSSEFKRWLSIYKQKIQMRKAVAQ